MQQAWQGGVTKFAMQRAAHQGHANVDGAAESSMFLSSSCRYSQQQHRSESDGQAFQVSMRTLKGERLLRHELVQRGWADWLGHRRLHRQQPSYESICSGVAWYVAVLGFASLHTSPQKHGGPGACTLEVHGTALVLQRYQVGGGASGLVLELLLRAAHLGRRHRVFHRLHRRRRASLRTAAAVTARRTRNARGAGFGTCSPSCHRRCSPRRSTAAAGRSGGGETPAR